MVCFCLIFLNRIKCHSQILLAQTFLGANEVPHLHVALLIKIIIIIIIIIITVMWLVHIPRLYISLTLIQ